nr:RNA polymerase sigma-70 factor [uncultured Pedobacter sp.]
MPWKLTLMMGNYSKHTDEELALLLKQAGPEIFKEIYDRYWDRLLNAAHKRVRNTEICEEIVQDVFTKLWANRSSLVFTAGIGNYLFTAVRYNVIDHYRKHAVRESFISSEQAYVKLDNSTEEYVFLNDLKKHIDTMIARLPVKCRSVYQLSRIEFKTNKEIASELNISEKTVEGHLTKALQSLRVTIGDIMPILLFFIK